MFDKNKTIALIEELTDKSTREQKLQECAELTNLKRFLIQNQSLNTPTQWAILPELLRNIKHLHPHLEKIYTLAEPFTLHSPDKLITNTKLAKQLLQLHTYLNGTTSNIHLDDLTVSENGDIMLGLGLKLSDGSLLEFFKNLTRKTPENPDEPFRNIFLDDAAQLTNAILSGYNAFDEYLKSQLILKYDPTVSKVTYKLPQTWENRLKLIAKQKESGKLQIQHFAAAKFEKTLNFAQKTDIKSLRAFALVFDTAENIAQKDIERTQNQNTDNKKILSLADAILGRMHGKLASHWQNRMKTVFDGYGTFENKIYDETRFLGPGPDKKTWLEAKQIEEELTGISETPKQQKQYKIKPGDNLQNLIKNAYKIKPDYNYILAQNPHITPQNILPGTIIYLPQWPLPQKEIQIHDHPVKYENNILHFFDRQIGPMDFLEQTQKDTLINTIKTSPLSSLANTDVYTQNNQITLAAQAIPLLTLHTPDPEILSRMKTIASQIRGDIILNEQISLPLGLEPSQPHRRDWLATRIKTLITNPAFRSITIHINTENDTCDLIDNLDNTIVRLTPADFFAIKNQPRRRLTALKLPTIQLNTLLAQLWAADLLQLNAEILTPPFQNFKTAVKLDNGHETLYFPPIGTPIFPIAGGIVKRCQNDPNLGNYVLIEHKNYLSTTCTHLATFMVHPGQTVNADNPIGRAGLSDATTQPTIGIIIQTGYNKNHDPFNTDLTSLKPSECIPSLFPPTDKIKISIS